MEKEMLEKIQGCLKADRVDAPAGLTETILNTIEERETAPASRHIYHSFITSLRGAQVAAVSFASVLAVVLLYEVTRPKEVTVTFALYNPAASTVSLAGDFNEWNPSNCRMINDNGKWKAALKLKPGQYQYMFVVNGSEWTPDPENREQVDSAFGGSNSVIDVSKI